MQIVAPQSPVWILEEYGDSFGYFTRAGMGREPFEIETGNWKLLLLAEHREVGAVAIRVTLFATADGAAKVLKQIALPSC